MSNASFSLPQSDEVAPKRKHLRNLILRSWTVRGADDFFRELSKSNRPVLTKVIVAHKTCICVHNLIQEGHPACLVDANRQRHLLDSLVSTWGGTRVAYAQIVTQYATYLLLKLDFHAAHQEWISDKEGNLDWDYFAERQGGHVPFDYAVATALSMLRLLGTAAQLMDFVRQGVAMDGRVHKEGVNSCVAHPLVNLVTDAHTLFATAVRLLQKAYDGYWEASDKQLDELEAAVAFLDQLHAALKPLFATCAATKYVAALVTVPVLDEEPPRFRKPPRDDRRQREEEERRRREEEMRRQQQLEDEQRRAMLARMQAEEDARRRQEEEDRRRAAEQLAMLARQQQQQQQDGVNAALLKYLTDSIGRGRSAVDEQSKALDAASARLQAKAAALQGDIGGLQAELDALLRENAELREQIAREHRQQEKLRQQLIARARLSAQSSVRAALETRNQQRELLAEGARELRAALQAGGGSVAEQMRALGKLGRGGSQVVVATGSKELGHALLEHLEKGGQEQRLQLLLQQLEEEQARRDPAIEREKERRAAELRARLEALLRRATGECGDEAAAAALEGVRAVSAVSAQLGLARLDRFEGGEQLAQALEELWAAGEGVRAAPEDPMAWSKLRAAAENVQIAALAFVRGQPGLEAGYQAVAAALKALMESALARQQQLASMQQQQSFTEDRDGIVEQRARVHRLAAHLQRKKTSTENLLAQLGGM